jgi:hypothetical protein
VTPNQLADELGISPKTLRAWLRRNWPRSVGQRGTEWELTIEQIRAARERWGAGGAATVLSDSPPRPYLRENADDLEARARANWDDVRIVSLVAIELFHRRTQRAGSLRVELVRRIEELIQQGFPWPTTDAPGGSGGLEIEPPAVGLLTKHGYRVGRSGLPEQERRMLLDNIYLDELMPVNSSEYMAEWGRPKTGPRLQKLAEVLAAETRSAKRRSTDLSTAIEQWEADLEYLRREYYVGRYDFSWPTT